MDVEKTLNRFEKTSNCWTWQADGLDIWPILKSAIIIRSAERSINTLRKLGVRHGLWRASLTFPRMASRFRTRTQASLPPFKPGAVLLIGGSSATRMIGHKLLLQPSAGLWLSARQNGKDCVVWLEDALEQQPQVQQNWCELTYGIKRVLMTARADASRLSNRLPPDCGPVLDICAQNCGLTRAQAATWLGELVAASLVLRQVTADFFDVCRPSRVVFMAGGYWSTAAYAAAARSRGIETVEVQHGVMNEGMAHDFLLHESRPNTLADIYFGYRPLVQSNGGFDRTRYVAGRPGTLSLADVGSNEAELQHAIREQEERLQEAMNHNGNTINILVSHQRFNNLAWLEPLVEQLGAGYQFWVRLRDTSDHVEIKQEILSRPNVDWKIATRTNLGVLLPKMQHHITQFSGTALEAACCGIKTYAVHEASRTVYAAQNDGLIEFCPVDQVAAKILADTRRTDTPVMGSDGASNQHYWELLNAAFTSLRSDHSESTRSKSI